jgi:hypothetical protein
MQRLLKNVFVLMLLCIGLIAGHSSLNGTWLLVPTLSNFAGDTVLQSGSVKIDEREHHIYISRNFNYDGSAGGMDLSFSTDGGVNSTVKNGKSFKSKVSWEGDSLKVKTTSDRLTYVEHYSLRPDGSLQLILERSDHQAQTLVFHRQ